MPKTESTVFFGSGPVAAACLTKLAQHTAIEMIVTKPRPPHHRGTTPVLELAEQLGLPVITASTKRELDSVLAAQHFSSRYAILIDFGIIVSQAVIDTFPLGIINSHFSLLPRLRGADPITWSIAEGDETTGVSLMLVDVGMDTGKLLTQRTLHIAPDDTSPSLTSRLIDLSDELLREYIPHYLSGELQPHVQPHPDRATYSRKLTTGDRIIDWSRPAVEIERRIRAFIEWPGSRAQLGDVEVIITSAHVASVGPAVPGTLLIEKSRLLVGTGADWLDIVTLKPLGKKEMPVQAFLAGYRHRI